MGHPDDPKPRSFAQIAKRATRIRSGLACSESPYVNAETVEQLASVVSELATRLAAREEDE